MSNACEYSVFLSHIFGNLAAALKSNRFNFARASRFFVHFFAITARLRHESSLLWRAKTQWCEFLFLFLNFDTVFRRTERDGISAIKFEAARIHFLVTLLLLSPSLLLELSQVPSRKRGVKLRHVVVYDIWLVSCLFFSFHIWYLWKWKFTSIGQSKHIWVTRFNPYEILFSQHRSYKSEKSVSEYWSLPRECWSRDLRIRLALGSIIYGHHKGPIKSIKTYRAFSLTWPVSMQILGTKESVYIRKEFNFHRTGLEHQHGRRFVVLGHQYGRLDVMWKHSINYMRRARLQSSLARFSILKQIPSMISLFENWNAIVVPYMKFISSLLRTSWAENSEVGSWNF